MRRLRRAGALLGLICAVSLGSDRASAQDKAPPPTEDKAPPAIAPPTTEGKAQSATEGKLYNVVDGYKVDPNTMNGFRAWRAAACDRCHGANQQGLVGPSLIDSLKTLSKDDFIKTVRDGRLDKGMMSFSSSKMVMDNIDNLYAYLKGRSNGDITRAKVEELKP